MATGRPLILSLFPGIGMLDLAFEMEMTGTCIARGPDLIYNSLSDIRRFHPPSGVFDGVVGGPPCQSFSALVHLVRANGHEPRFGNLIPEFERVVAEAQPRWFLMENVTGAPSPAVEGYTVREQVLNNRWFGAECELIGAEQTRARRFCFGSLDPNTNPWPHLEVALFEAPMKYVAVKGDPRPTRQEARSVISGNGFDNGSAYYKRQSTAVVSDLRETPVRVGGSGKVKKRVSGSVTAAHGYIRDAGGAVTSSDGGGKVRMSRYSLADACELQGLPRDFLDDAPFTAQGKLRAVANGVPLFMGRAVARAIKQALAVTP